MSVHGEIFIDSKIQPDPSWRGHVFRFAFDMYFLSSVVSGEGAAESHPAEGDPQSAGVQAEVSQPPCQLCVWVDSGEVH